MIKLTNDWGEILHREFEKDYFIKLNNFLEKEYSCKTLYPKREDVFNALQSTAYENTKVVIIGQDPYHGENQAHGLSFSVQPGVTIPPSLRNIYKELETDLRLTIPNHGCLQHWTKEGVLLLNTVLTVEAKKPNSHKGLGWEQFTDEIISTLNEREKPVVFILWGRHAQEKQRLISNKRHFIIMSPHPSPFSARRGFFGSKPFSKTNEFLRSIRTEEINWNLPMIKIGGDNI